MTADYEVARDLARRARELLDGLDGMETKGLLDPENVPAVRMATREFEQLTEARMKLSMVLSRYDAEHQTPEEARKQMRVVQGLPTEQRERISSALFDDDTDYDETDTDDDTED